MTVTRTILTDSLAFSCSLGAAFMLETGLWSKNLVVLHDKIARPTLSHWDFSVGSSHTIDSKTGSPVATLAGTWCYRVSAGTG